MINKNILFLTAALFFTLNMHAQWVKEYIHDSNNLNSIAMFSESMGLVVGDNGTIFQKSNDGWSRFQNITEENLYSVCIIDEHNAWAAGGNGVILHFDGMDWTNVESPTRSKLYSISFSDSETGYASGAHGTVLKYKNGAWTTIDKTTRGNLYSVIAKGSKVIIGGGLECQNVPLLKFSDNNGNKLDKEFEPDFVEVKGLAIASQTSMWAVGSPSSILHFNGNKWTALEQYEKTPSLNAICFSDENHGLAVGFSGTIMTFSNGEWTIEPSHASVKLNGAAIAGNTYYAVGNDGTILSLKNAFLPAKEQEKPGSKINLSSFPNPTADILNITIPEGDEHAHGSLTVTNTFGKIILKKELDAVLGGQNVQISISDLSNGLYLIQFASPSTTASGKFVVRH